MRNPYIGTGYDENQLRRNALLEALDEPPASERTRDRTRPSTPEPETYDPRRPGVARPYSAQTTIPDPSRIDFTRRGDEMGEATINDPAPAPAPAPAAPTGPDLGNQPAAARDAELENTLIDQYMGSFTPRGGYGGLEPTRKAISMGLLQSGEPYSMVSGAFGMLDAYMRRRAESAPTDYNIGDVRIGLQNAYRDMFGTDIDPAFLDQTMRGQGYQPEEGDRYGGRDGLGYILNQWYHQSAPDRAAREAAAAGETPAATTPGAAAAPTTPGSGGGLPFEGFDFAQDAANRDRTKSAKYSFAAAAQEAAPLTDTSKPGYEQWLRTEIAPRMERDGHRIVGFNGERIDVESASGSGWVDVGRGAGGPNSALAWQPDDVGGGQGGGEGGAVNGRSGAKSVADAYAWLKANASPGMSRGEMESLINVAFADVPGFVKGYAGDAVFENGKLDLITNFEGPGASWSDNLSLIPLHGGGGAGASGTSLPGGGLGGFDMSSIMQPGVSLAPVLGRSDVLQQIMDEIRRIQSGAPPRDALLAELGG
jgi:hypothetical protein